MIFFDSGSRGWILFGLRQGGGLFFWPPAGGGFYFRHRKVQTSGPQSINSEPSLRTREIVLLIGMGTIWVGPNQMSREEGGR